MSYVIDEVARSLANPTPRRKALRLIGGLLAGAFFAARQEAHAQNKGKGPCKDGCPGGQCCCSKSKSCVVSTGANGEVCVDHSQNC
jgi:hypothetical protein